MSDNKDQNLTPTSSATTAGTAAFGGDSPNLAAAALGGLIAAIVGALIWAVITVTAKFQIGFMAVQAADPVMSVTLRVLGNPSSIATILQETFRGMDLLFYAIAVYEGYKLARRP